MNYEEKEGEKKNILLLKSSTGMNPLLLHIVFRPNKKDIHQKVNESNEKSQKTGLSVALNPEQLMNCRKRTKIREKKHKNNNKNSPIKIPSEQELFRRISGIVP